jgi:hypothetical protein
VRLWVDGSQSVVLMLAHPTGLPVEDEPWYLISNAAPSLDRVWSYAQRFCCEQLFRDQKSGVFQLESSGLREAERIDRLLLVVAIAVLAGSLQGYALSLAGLRRQVDPHWQRGMSFLRIGLAALQMAMFDAAVVASIMAALRSCSAKPPAFERIQIDPRETAGGGARPHGAIGDGRRRADILNQPCPQRLRICLYLHRYYTNISTQSVESVAKERVPHLCRSARPV